LRADDPRGAGAVRVYVRPHELEVEALTGRSTTAVEAQVVSLHAAGPVVRAEFVLDGGARLVAELSPRRQAALALLVGARVAVHPRSWRAYR
jgi:ABC-type sulfate/molybdate transport systems ATPase subunit